MRLISTIVIVGACLGSTLPHASGGPARFWISESRTSPGVPEAPTINSPIGRQRTLYIWAQPATDTGGAFRELENFSLDVVTLDTSLAPEPAPFIDFIDGTYRVENPTVIGAEKRFQYTADSFRAEAQGGPLTSERATEVILDFDLPDAVKGLQGAAPFANPSTVGIGHPSDPYRYPSGSSFAWRVGEFSFQALESSGTNYLFLQVGYHGVRHVGDPDITPTHPCSTSASCPTGTDVYFGNDSVTYNAHNLGHRQTSLSNETFDLRINAVPAVEGDFNGDGDIDQEDYAAWQSEFGESVPTFGDGADGNSDGAVNAADYVVWRKLLSSAGSSPVGIATSTIPEPSTISLGAILFLLTWRNVAPHVRRTRA